MARPALSPEERKEHKRLSTKRWRETNREQVRASGRHYHVTHSEQEKARRKRYYEKNRDRLLAERRANHEQNRIYASHYREKNREKLNENNRRSLAEKLRRGMEYKVALGCCVCGEKHPAVLSCHHRNGEEKLDAIAALCNYRWERVEAELKKCDVMCENCHRKLHWQEKVNGTPKG